MIDWSRYPNFTKEEFDCKHTGKNEMKAELLDAAQELRNRYGKPISVNSGYRDKTHPIERRKKRPGSHFSGLAFDIKCSRQEAYELARLAFEIGFTGIGFNQHGDGRFLHLDMIPPDSKEFLRPTIWSYK